MPAQAKPRAFAEGTVVPASKSQEQIEKTIKRFGCDGFAMHKDTTRVAIMFVLLPGTPEERRVRYVVPMPNLDAVEFTRGRGKSTEASRQLAWEAEVNRRWRALARAIEGKVIAVQENIETFEEAFWAHIVTPTGRTVYEETQEPVAAAYRTGNMPPLLPGIGTSGARWVIERKEPS